MKQIKSCAVVFVVLLVIYTVIQMQSISVMKWQFLIGETRNKTISDEFPRNRTNFTETDIFNTTQENMTLVTAYLELGRINKGRIFDKNTYTNWATAYRFVNNPLVIYTESDGFFNHMMNVRQYLPEKTKILKIDRKTLWPFQKIDKIKAIFSIPGYPRHSPNTINPAYSATQHAKYAFVEDAIRKGYFPNKFYAWIDIGYFRGSENINRFYQLFAPPDLDIKKLAINQIRGYRNSLKPSAIFKGNYVWANGGMFIGTPSLILNFTKLYRRAFDFFLEQKLMNTDQQMLYAIYSDEGRKSIKPEIELQLYPPKQFGGDPWFYLGYHCRHLLPVDLCPSRVPVCPVPGYPKHRPNTIDPSYSAMQHSKYPLIVDAINKKYFPNEFYAWIDIGYFRDTVNINKYYELFSPADLDVNKIAFNNVNGFNKGLSPSTIFRGNVFWVGGGMFIGTPNLLLDFSKLYKRAFDHFVNQNLMNTDQQIIYSLYSDEGRKSLKPEIEIQPFTPKNFSGDKWFYLGYSCRHFLPKGSGEGNITLQNEPTLKGPKISTAKKQMYISATPKFSSPKVSSSKGGISAFSSTTRTLNQKLSYKRKTPDKVLNATKTTLNKVSTSTKTTEQKVSTSTKTTPQKVSTSTITTPQKVSTSTKTTPQKMSSSTKTTPQKMSTSTKTAPHHLTTSTKAILKVPTATKTTPHKVLSTTKSTK